MDKSLAWVSSGFIAGLAAVLGVLSIEFLAQLNGSLDRDILLVGTITVLILVLFSWFSLFKANRGGNSSQIALSVFFGLVLLLVLIFDVMLLIIYFGGK